MKSVSLKTKKTNTAPSYITQKSLSLFIDQALKEDIGPGDHTTLATIGEETTGTANVYIKADGVLAGVDFTLRFWEIFDPKVKVNPLLEDGSAVEKDTVAMTLEGPARSLLTGERLMLNCMQRMSGIATKTRNLLSLIKGSRVMLLDTRKTTPNFRMLEKWAVHIGGAKNHRFGLFDQILLKDNHIDLSGGVAPAVNSAKQYLNKHQINIPIEVETRSLEEVKAALSTNQVDIIMLDNMIPSEMKSAVELIKGKCKTEASGGISEVNIREVAETGVDFISVGALTHSYESLDISLKIKL